VARDHFNAEAIKQFTCKGCGCTVACASWVYRQSGLDVVSLDVVSSIR
jgi:hypothetical protein